MAELREMAIKQNFIVASQIRFLLVYVFPLFLSLSLSPSLFNFFIHCIFVEIAGAAIRGQI